jgi:hypothetical protein
MKKETIGMAVVIVIAAIIAAIGIATTYPNPWGVSGTGPSIGNMMGPGLARSGTMGPGMMGSGMMGGMGMMTIYSADSQPISGTDVRNRVLAYASQYYPGAKIGDFMEFSLNYYVELQDASNASIAEILVDRYTGRVTPEPGPNMMWNTRYSGRSSAVSVAYNMAAAKSKAEKFLEGYLPGSAILDTMQYPGYYTFDFGRDRIEGMLSVNAYTGAIWVHTWHGQFIGE